MAFSACLAQVKKESAQINCTLGKISPEIVQAIAVACDQLSQTSESWTYAFPLHLTIDVYQGGAGTSININSNEVLAGQSCIGASIPFLR